MDSSVSNSTVTLDDILFNLKPEPYTLRQFYLFSEKVQNVELLDFWITVQDLRNMYEPEHPRSSYLMNNWGVDKEEEEGEEKETIVNTAADESEKVKEEKEEMVKEDIGKEGESESQWTVADTRNTGAQSLRRSRALTETLNAPRPKPKKIDMKKYADAQRLIVACYIAEDAPLEVNLSDEMRRKVLAKAPKSEEDPPTPRLFDEAQTECEKLMLRNQYPLFKKEADIASKDRKFAPIPPPRPKSSLKGKTPAPLPE